MNLLKKNDLLKKNNLLGSKHLSIFTAALILVLSVCSPLSSKAAEADAGTGSTLSSTEAGTQSAAQTASEEPFRYQHDPMENPAAAKDIVVNPDAVYGYSPNPESTRLGKYADALDWTDKDQVAAAREERKAYLEEFNTLYKLIEDMLGEGKNVEEIARAVSAKRNEIRLAAYDNDPERLEIVKQSNLDTYGHEEGPTPDQLFEKYGSWQTVIEKALSSNPGMDACLGFYDEYYDAYDISDRVGELSSEAGNEDAASQEDASDQDSAASGTSKTYTVKKGDCLWSIAASELGDGNRWPEIYELNKDKISNPRLIYAGQELTLPDA